jgi:hypothetical protein
MELRLETEKLVLRVGEPLWVRLLILNDGYTPIVIDRALLVGPNLVVERSVGMPLPISLEPSAAEGTQSQLILNPWCFYGRQRTFDSAAGRVTFHGYLLKKLVESLLPEGPSDPNALLIAAEPLVVTVE